MPGVTATHAMSGVLLHCTLQGGLASRASRTQLPLQHIIVSEIRYMIIVGKADKTEQGKERLRYHKNPASRPAE